MDPRPSPNAALAEAARAVALRRLGRVRLPVRVVVALTDQLELDGVSVELAALPSPESDEADGPLASRLDCLRDVQAALARAGHRLTTNKILAALDQTGAGHSETHVKRTLAWAAAVEQRLLTKDPDADPPGYGLPGWN